MKAILKILIVILLIGCNTNKNSFTINANTDRVGDAILLKIDPVKNNIDTTSIKNGKFSFKNNIIFRELEILKISNGEANLIKGLQ